MELANESVLLPYVWLGKPVAEAIDPSRVSKAVRQSGAL